MTGFSEGFRQYLPPDEEMIGRALTKGLITIDANVLLDAYRYASDARAELLRVLQNLGDRLWVSHQVALEFHRNRVSVISGHRDSYRDVLKATQEFRLKYESELAKQLHEFVNRVALPDGERAELLRHVVTGLDALSTRLNQLQALHGISDRFVSNDPVLKQLQQLLDNKVGPPLSVDEEAAARQEAQRRIENQVPPGFKDASKDDPCGDYLVWHQILLEAKARAVPLVFITRDTKEDWFLKVKGKTISALPELVLEAQRVAGVDFVAMTTKTFLVHSQRFLATEISKTTLDQTEAIRRNSRQRQVKPQTFQYLPEVMLLLVRDLETDIQLLSERQHFMDRAIRRLDESPNSDQKDRARLMDILSNLKWTRDRLEEARVLLRSGTANDDGTITVEIDDRRLYRELISRLDRLPAADVSDSDERARERRLRKVWATSGEIPFPGLDDDDAQ